jgi:uncharacterized protein (TIGR02246 family)
LLLTLPGITQAQAGDESAIRAARERFNQAIAQHDTSAMAADWADEVRVISSRGDLVIGRAANLAIFAKQFAARPHLVYRRVPRTVRILDPWDAASEAGEWTGSWTEPGGTVRVSGRYLAQWKREAGRWKLSSEYFVPERCESGSYCRQR